MGQGIWVARQGLPTSSKTQGEVSAIKAALLPPQTNVELAWQLQQEELVVEEAWLG